MEVTYIGEHLFEGNLGYFFVSLAFGAALFALISFIMANKYPQSSWKSIARWGFLAHAIGIVGIVSVLFYLIQNHWYEYHYVWSHSSNDLPVHYMISCFWEGQEGSFLLWAFWHVVLGAILLRTAKKWESPVMITVMLAQVMLVAMLLGLNLWGDATPELGMNPFKLLRNEMNAPIFASADYITKIGDGSGLNPLLQNYWMVIHPPILFLGFALTIIPFAYAMASLYNKTITDWVKPALPWSGVATGVLGIGILMGGAWAYEALSFGGFWAWDPVENAVLVPWLVLVGGLHTMVIFKNTGKALWPSYIMIISAFILILYSTFLTRSGVLGDSSVHSFTDLGLSGQLLLFLGMFVVLSVFFLIYRRKSFPKKETEEKITSRELWMLVGSLVLIVSAFQVIFSTSIPVFNKIFNGLSFVFGKEFNMAPPVDPIEHYNKFQVPFAVLIALLTAVGQYFKYRKTKSTVWKKLLTSFLISVPVSAGLVLSSGVSGALYFILLLTSVYAVVGNIEMMIPNLKWNKIKFSGASITHIGIGLLFIGALISNAQKQVVSINKSGIDYGDAFTKQDKIENVYLPKGKPVNMGGYVVTYLTDSVAEPNHYYKVEYKKVDPETGEVKDRFVLKPNAQINPDMGLISDPSIERRFGWDLYTHVSSVPSTEEEDEFEEAENFRVKGGEVIEYKDFKIEVSSINLNPDLPDKLKSDSNLIASSLPLKITKGGQSAEMNPLFLIKNKELIRPASINEEIGLRAFFVNIYPKTQDFEIALSAKRDQSPPYIIMKAMVFPMINFLWIGSILIFVGSIIAAYRRFFELK